MYPKLVRNMESKLRYFILDQRARLEKRIFKICVEKIRDPFGTW